MKKARVSLALDVKGGFLIESSRAAVRVFASETEDGGIYFEFAVERGRTWRTPSGSDPHQRSVIGTVCPEQEAAR